MCKKFIAVVSLLIMILSVSSFCESSEKIDDLKFLEQCKSRDTQGVIEAIQAGTNVNSKGSFGGTALMLAAFDGHSEIVNALIEAGADVNAKKNSGRTALMSAAEKGHTEIVKALIEAGAEVNAQDDSGMTALMWAAYKGHTETVNALIEAGADDLTDNDGKTALMYAANNGNAQTVNALIDAGSYVKQREKRWGGTALDYARRNDKLKGTDALDRLEELSR